MGTPSGFLSRFEGGGGCLGERKGRKESKREGEEGTKEGRKEGMKRERKKGEVGKE